ncbi:MAG TPA: OmpA family protein [candidate division Zixibacteria bacterium]|nr:OmpA family protein [candidate division Zixibacteria bacterium]
MRALQVAVVVAALASVPAAKPVQAAPDEYDDSQSHPLRVAAYLVHPGGVLLEWVIFRPLHLLVSGTEFQEKIFGHTPHPPIMADPDKPYGAMQSAPRRGSAPPQAAAKPRERVVETVKTVEVPVERTVYKEVPKIVEVEKVVLPDVAFRFDSAQLTDLGKGKVYLAAQRLKEKSDLTVVIEGHADEVGSEEYNRRLGLRRAQAVLAELQALGIDPARVTAVSQGESRPLIDQPTSWARAVNRRVEFQVKGK